MKLFKPEDFTEVTLDGKMIPQLHILRQQLADAANYKLEQSLKTLYGNPDHSQWTSDKKVFDTHKIVTSPAEPLDSWDMRNEVTNLVGLKVNSVDIDSGNDLVILGTDKGFVYLTWEGDCCAHCYLNHVDGAKNLIDATILEVENMEWEDISGKHPDGNVTESMGTKIKTTKGYVTLETRLEHNGYYGGEIIVTTKSPISGTTRLKKLEDF